MRQSSSSASLLLPFGALTGVIPIDAVPRPRVLGDFSAVLPGMDRRISDLQQQIHSAIEADPVVPRSRRPAE